MAKKRGFLDLLAVNYFMPYARPLVTKKLEDKLLVSGYGESPQLYMAKTLAIVFLVALGTVGFVMFLSLFIPQVLIPGLLLSVAATTITYSLAAGRVDSMLSKQKELMEEELSFLAAFFSVIMAGSGNLYIAIDRLAESDYLKESARIARMIQRDRAVTGATLVEAMEKYALLHPSTHFREFITGLIAALRAGSDVAKFCRIKTGEYFEKKFAEAEARAKSLNTTVNILLLTVTTMMPLFTILSFLGSLQAFGSLQVSSVDPAFSAMISIMLLTLLPIMVHLRMPKSLIPIPELAEIYSGVARFALPGAAAAMAIVYFTGATPLNLAIAIILGATPALVYGALAWNAVSDVVERVDYSLSELLLDLAKEREAGFTIEMAFRELLAKRNYGPIDRYVKEAARNIAYGISLKKSIENMRKYMRSWELQVVFWMMSESVEFGGLTKEVLEMLSEFTRMLAQLGDRVRQAFGAVKRQFAALGGTLLLIMVFVLKLAASQQSFVGGGEEVPSATFNLERMAIMGELMIAYAAIVFGLTSKKLETGFFAAGFGQALMFLLGFMSMYLAALIFVGVGLY